jgi:hypothetical protein
MVPEDVKKAVAKQEEQLSQQEKQEAFQAAEAEKRRQTNEEWKESQFSQTLARAKDVIEWAKRAAKEDAVKRLIALEQGTYYNGLLLFCDEYLHYEPAGFGAYACTYLLKNGSLLYIESYKWYGISTRDKFHEPKQLAKTLHPTYVKSLHDCLMSGKVWNGVSIRVKTTTAEDQEWFDLTNEDKEDPHPRGMSRQREDSGR